MKFIVREKNPGPRVTVVKNGEVVLESGNVPVNNEPVMGAPTKVKRILRRK